MKIENLANLDRLVSEGWTLTVSLREMPYLKHERDFQASVYLTRRNGPESHHFVRTSVIEALVGLDKYVEFAQRQDARTNDG